MATCQIFAMARQRHAGSCPTRCVASVVPGTLSTAICSGLPLLCGPAHLHTHGHQVTGRRIVPCGQNSAFVGMGVSEDSGPTVFLTFADRAYLKQNQPCPSLQ